MDKQFSCVAELTRSRAEKTMIAKKKKKTHSRITTENNKKTMERKNTHWSSQTLSAPENKKWKNKSQLCNYTYNDTVYFEVQ